jgi:C4-dicarboxylate-binding protein DctP
MGHSFADVMGAVDPALMVFETPFLFRGYRHMEGVFEGPLGAELLDGLKAKGILGLSFTYSGGASGVASVEREIRQPSDLKGLKVGVFGDSVNEAWLKELGATPVPIGHDLPRIAKLAGEGALDAVVITWRNLQQAKLYPAFKYYSLPASTYLVSLTYVNQKFFEGLPADYRRLILEESVKAGRIERAKTIELNEVSAKRELMANGVRAVHLSAQARERFVEALAPAYKTIEAAVGAGLPARVRKAADAPEHPLMPVDVASR